MICRHKKIVQQNVQQFQAESFISRQKFLLWPTSFKGWLGLSNPTCPVWRERWRREEAWCSHLGAKHGGRTRQTWEESDPKGRQGYFSLLNIFGYCVIQPFCWFWRWLYSMLTSCAPRTSSPPACLPPKWRHWIKYIYSLTFHNLQNIHTEDPLVRTSRDLETKCRWRINFLELLDVHLPSILLRVKVYNGAKDH